MLTIAPPPCWIISGMAYFAISTIEVTLTRMARSQASMSTSTAVPGGPPMPTLFTRMSSRPQVRTVSRTMRSQSCGTVTSASTISEVPPSASIMCWVRSAQSWF